MDILRQLLTLYNVIFYILLLHPIKEASATGIPNCNFEDTVNITGSLRFDNGSYLHEDILIPAELTAVYDYEVLHLGLEEPVPQHMRGCICKLRSCVKFCCHPSELKVPDARECNRELELDLEYSPYVNITFHNGSQRLMHVIEEFFVQKGIPCHDAYPLQPQLSDDERWNLFENGTLFRHYDEKYLSKRDYCLLPGKINDTYVLNPINCPYYPEEPETQIVNSIAMLISIPFLVLTILVYVFIPELRNLHGKCLICYLSSLALGYTMIVITALSMHDFTNVTCNIVGFTGYFCLMSAFSWLSVISFDLWHNFRGTQHNVQRYMQKKRFYVYACYALAVPIILTTLTILAQQSNLEDSLKPGIGDMYCWLKPEDWSAMIYFYGPTLILIIFNSVMFILTSLKIYGVKKELERMMSREEGTRRMSSENDNFGLFLRLFIVMGVTWLLEVFSYMVGSWSIWAIFFYLPDLLNAAQGIIIFVLFVMKRKVLKLIKKRVRTPENEPFMKSSRYRSSGKSTSQFQLSTVTLSKVTKTDIQ